MTCAGQASTPTVALPAGWADTAPWVGSACRAAGPALELTDAATGEAADANGRTKESSVPPGRHDHTAHTTRRARPIGLAVSRPRIVTPVSWG